jgi:hypothetical protein
MSDLREWSTVANSNNASAPHGWPEGMDKSGVNDSAREMMAALKTWYEDAEWLYLNTVAQTVTKDTDTQVRIDLVDLTSEFSAGRRVKVSNGSTTVEAFVQSAAMNAGDTVVTLEEISGAGIVPAGADDIQAHASPGLGKAAWRDNGTASDEVPLNSDLGELAYLDEGDGDCDTLDGLEADEIIEAAAVVPGNLLVNGDFERWQEGTPWASPDNTDGVYFADQWVALYEGASDTVDIEKVTASLPADVQAAVKLTWNNTDEKAAIYQMVEHFDCAALLGGSQSASLTFRVAHHGASGQPAAVRAAIIAWNGTVDVPTADPISSWPAAGADPVLKTSFAIEGSASLTISPGWNTFTLEGVAIDLSGAVNVGILIWSDDDTIPIGSTLTIGRVRLVPGSRALDLAPELHTTMMARTWRFFWKSFDEDTAPAHATEANSALRWTSNVGATGRNVLDVMLPVRMHKADASPSYYNPANASPGTNYVYDFTGTDSEPVTGAQFYAHRFRLMADAPGTGNDLGIHVALDARFF